MMPLLALKKLVRSALVTEVDCEVRSDSVRAISVTLRSTATPEENSTVPKNITSMIGTMMANSVAAMPLRSARMSAARRRRRNQTVGIGNVFIVLSQKGSFLNAAVAVSRRLLPARLEML